MIWISRQTWCPTNLKSKWKVAIFNPKSHAPETSEGSESASILLVRLFYISQANFTSFSILVKATVLGRFRGALVVLMKFHNLVVSTKFQIQMFWQSCIICMFLCSKIKCSSFFSNPKNLRSGPCFWLFTLNHAAEGRRHWSKTLVRPIVEGIFTFSRSICYLKQDSCKMKLV